MPLPLSQRHTSFMFLRHAFAVGMFLVKTDFYLHQLGYGHTVYRSVFAGLPCTCFHDVFITNRWCCCACFNLKVDLIFLLSYCFFCCCIAACFLTSQLILREGKWLSAQYKTIFWWILTADRSVVMHFIFNAFPLWLIKGVYAYSCFAVCSIVWLHIFWYWK